MLDALTFGRSVYTPPPPKREIRNDQRVNTSLCRFLQSFREKLSAPLCEETSVTPLEWYEAACSEDGPNVKQSEAMGAYQGTLQDFNRGGFAEFRVMRVLEELVREGLFENFVTNFQLPRVGVQRVGMKDQKSYAKNFLLSGKNLSLDPFKIDALIHKQLTSGQHLYLPIQVKYRKKDESLRGRIPLLQKDAATLRRKYPSLRGCFSSLHGSVQSLCVKRNYHTVGLARSKGAGEQASAQLPTKTKAELKTEIAEALRDDRWTFTSSTPIHDFQGMSMLETLLDSGLLQGVVARR